VNICNDLLTYCLHLELLTYLWLGSSPVTSIVTSLEKTVETVESENSDASDVDEVIEIVSKFCNNFRVLRYSRNVLKTSLNFFRYVLQLRSYERLLV